MVKKEENADLNSPDSPRNRTPMSEENGSAQNPNNSTVQLRRTPRKRSRPQFYASPATPQSTSSIRSIDGVSTLEFNSHEFDETKEVPNPSNIPIEESRSRLNPQEKEMAKAKRLQSDIFIKHFSKIQHLDGALRAHCSYCEKSYSWKKGNGYGTLSNHLASKHPVELGVDSSESQILTCPTGAESSATETSNGNQLSTAPSRSLQEQNTKENSTPETNNQVGEQGSPLNSSPPLHHQDRQKASVKESNERVGNVGVNDHISQGIDPKILQHVTNAIDYMTGNQTDAKVKSVSSNVNDNLADMLKAIYRKHGDITLDCSLESDSMKTLVLLGICKLVQDLRTKQLKDLDIGSLNSYYKTVRDAENMKVNVQWLRNRLDEINDAVAEAKDLVNEKYRRLEDIDSKKQKLLLREVELERLKSEIRDIEDQLVQEVAIVEGLNKRISAKFSQFQHANLMDGLI